MNFSFLIKGPRHLLLVICSIIVAAFIFFAETTSGLRLLFRYVNPILQANGIQIDPHALHGRLSSIRLDELHYHEKITIHARDIIIEWDPLSAFSQQVLIHDIHADFLAISLAENPAPEASTPHLEPKNSFKLPAIRTDHLEIRQFSLNSSTHEEIIQHTNVSGDATITNDEIYFNHLQSDFLGFKTKLFGNISLKENDSIELKGQLSQTTKLGSLDLSLLLILADHTLTIKGDGTIISGETKIPVSYELAEKNDQFGLLAWDSKNIHDPQFLMELNFPAARNEPWHAKINILSLDFSHVMPISTPLDIKLEASGNFEQQSIKLHANDQKLRTLDFNITRTQIPQGFELAIQSLSFDYPGQHWSLDKAPHLIDTSLPLYQIKDLCIVNQLSRICGNGSYLPPNQFKLHITSDYFENQTLNSFLDPIRLLGVSQFEFNLEHVSDHPLANLTVNSNNAMVNLDDKKIQFSHAVIKSDYQNNQAQFNVEVLTTHEDRGFIDLHIQNLNKKSPAIQGFLDLNLKELNPLNLYLNNFYEIEGSIEAKIKLGGTLDDPTYQGSLVIGDSQAHIPQLGLTLQHIDLQLSGEGEREIRIKGTADSNGPITLDALISLSRQEMSSEATLKAEHIKLVDLPPAQAIGSFEFQFKQINSEAKLNGSLHIEQGKFDGRMLQRRFGNNTDIVFINMHREAPTFSSFKPQYEVKLIIDNSTRFQGFDVITQIGGEVDIHSRPQGSPVGTGQLNLINGSYDSYSKHFTIEKGALIYNQSTLDNPNLDVTARYDLQDSNFTEDGFNKLEITIHALGSLTQPKLVLSSKPPLSQEDILSYLVLGTPVSQAGDHNSVPLSQAALAFALKGGSQNVLNNIRKDLGLSQLSLGAITPGGPGSNTMPTSPTGEDRGFEDNTAVFVGKSISPNLYVSYGVGLFNAQQTFRTRLKLGRRWQLITESSNLENSADFIYIIERGD